MEEIKQLRDLTTIRQRCQAIFDHALTGTSHFTIHLDKMQSVVKIILQLIQRDYPNGLVDIPPHGRWRHYEMNNTDRIRTLMATWTNIDPLEQARRVLDLFVVSVLLDAGAGEHWVFAEEGREEHPLGRSEGLALAALSMFKQGTFSTDTACPHRVDADGLENLTAEDLVKGFQVDDSNPLVGVEGRCALLNRLGKALRTHPQYFGTAARPGHMLDFLLEHPTTKQVEGSKVVQLQVFWDSVIMDGFSSVWPETRTFLHGVSMGDVWPSDALESDNVADTLVPFHKLSQWLTYSLIEVMEKTANVKFEGVELLTGLPEYRNGGLFVDTGVLVLSVDDYERGESEALSILPQGALPTAENHLPIFTVDDPAIVEWRALTVILLDKMADLIRDYFECTPSTLSLAKVLESGTWKAGRFIAAEKRPRRRGPPINIVSDGTVF